MPNIESGQNILFLDAFLAHFGAPMQEWLAQPNVSSRIGLKGIAAHLTKYVIDSQSKSNIIFLHHRYVQLFNVSFHADFQREFDRGVLVANAVFGKDFSLELTAPTALDSTLVHQYCTSL